MSSDAFFVRFPWGSKLSPLSSVGQYLGYQCEFCLPHQFITVQTDMRVSSALKILITSFSKQDKFDGMFNISSFWGINDDVTR